MTLLQHQPDYRVALHGAEVQHIHAFGKVAEVELPAVALAQW